jgi:transcriptional regulator with GAF, ATPase, and Fis domain
VLCPSFRSGGAPDVDVITEQGQWLPEKERDVDSPSRPRLGDLVAAAAQTINTPQTLDERVQAVVGATPGTVPGFDQVSISLTYSDGLVETRSASSELVETLDALQYEAGEGPCYDAFTEPSIVTSAHLRHEQRWPVYVPRAAQAGVSAQMALPLRDGNNVRGALNLYSTTAEGIHPEAVDIATLFATHVALALGWARTHEQLGNALATRKTIGQAIGLLMERYQINEEKAFAFLVRVSSTGNIKLKDVAHELVTQTDTRYTIKD